MMVKEIVMLIDAAISWLLLRIMRLIKSSRKMTGNTLAAVEIEACME
jgi:hypothetical protein